MFQYGALEKDLYLKNNDSLHNVSHLEHYDFEAPNLLAILENLLDIDKMNSVHLFRHCL